MASVADSAIAAVPADDGAAREVFKNRQPVGLAVEALPEFSLPLIRNYSCQASAPFAAPDTMLRLAPPTIASARKRRRRRSSL
jgi:hypothetical protein